MICPRTPTRKFLGPATVVGNAACAEGFYVMRLEAPGFPRAIEPGQFVHLRLTEGTQPFLRRPFSICDVLAQDGAPVRLDLLYEVVGQGTDLMSRLRPGASLSLLGPLGRGYRAPAAPAAPILIGGGVGIPPLLYLAKGLISRRPADPHPTRDGAFPPADVRVQLGARTAGAMCLAREFRDLGVRVELATDDGTLGHRGYVTDLLRQALAEPGRPREVLACGPTPMLKAVAALARAAGVPCQLSLENRMGCALAACRACVWPVRDRPGSDADWHYETVCREGPVFDLERLVI